MKHLAKKTGLMRRVVREYRLRTGQPKWDALARSEEYRRAVADSAEGRARILIATGGGGYLAGTRIESLLAAALALRGASPHVLLCDAALPACLECDVDWYRDEKTFAERGPASWHCRSCFGPAAEMYRSLGLAVHKYSDFLTPEDIVEADRVASGLPTEEIARFRIEGFAVGEHALAGALRFYARATLTDRWAEGVLRRYLKAAILTTRVSQRILSAYSFDAVVFHHGIYVPQGLVGEVARGRGVRVVNWHVAYRKRCFIFSHHDTYHHTLISEPTKGWEQMDWTADTEREILDYLRSRWTGANDWIVFNRNAVDDLQQAAAELGVDFSRPCIGMLTNVMWDAQLHYPANAFANMLEWTLETIACFARRPDLQLIIRVHPAEISGTLPSRQLIVDEIAKAFPRLPPNVFVIPPDSHLSTYAIMLQTNAVIIYGTKTGVELAAMGKPVIVAGEAWIRNKGITWDVASKADYFRLLDALPFPAPLDTERLERARRYAYHFFFRRMIPLPFVVPTAGIPGFEVQLQGSDDLAPGRSVGLDVICDGILKGSEFVYPAERLPRPPGPAEPAEAAAPASP